MNKQNFKIGDIIVNPWVSAEFRGLLDGYPNPNYATIYIGNGQCIDINGRIRRFGFSTKVNDRDPNEPEREWRVIGHVNIREMIMHAIQEDRLQEPTDKQRKYADYLARRMSVSLPETPTKQAYSDFISKWKPVVEKEDAGMNERWLDEGDYYDR